MPQILLFASIPLTTTSMTRDGGDPGVRIAIMYGVFTGVLVDSFAVKVHEGSKTRKRASKKAQDEPEMNVGRSRRIVNPGHKRLPRDIKPNRRVPPASSVQSSSAGKTC